MPDTLHPAAAPVALSRPDHAVRLLHTSDIHVGAGYRNASGSVWPEQALEHLARLIALARAQDVQVMLIAGDFFDHNRVKAELVATTGELLETAGIPVVILPGNHDPYTSDSVYARHAGLFPDNVRVIRAEAGELIVLPEPGVQVWGQAHVHYDDFAPAQASPGWREDPRGLWRIALAHGLYVRSDYEKRLSYRIHDHEIEALGAHYVGLGHLEGHEAVGPGHAPAHYAGSPDISGGATIADLTPGRIEVRHVKS